MSSLKEGDIRKKILPYFSKNSESKPPSKSDALARKTMGMTKDFGELTARMELKLAQALMTKGYALSRNQGKCWSDTLLVVPKTGTDGALIFLENIGESEDTRTSYMQQQISLERAGRHCIRVSLVHLILDFQSTVDSIVRYLEGAGIVSSPDAAQTTHAASAPVDEVQVTPMNVDNEKEEASSDSSNTGVTTKDSAMSSSQSTTEVDASKKRKFVEQDGKLPAAKQPKPVILFSKLTPFKEHAPHLVREIQAMDPSYVLPSKPKKEDIKEALQAVTGTPKGRPLKFIPLTKYYQDWLDAE
jgi:hypothetical protein